MLTPAAEHRAERELRSTVRVDGFLAPIGDRREDTFTSGMYSGKRHRCGFNIQVVGSADGRLVLVGDPQPGAMHDARAWQRNRSGRPVHRPAARRRRTRRLRRHRLHRHRPDRTPTAKPPARTAPNREIEFNRAIASRRASVERVIAHLKNWKLLATGYRGLLDRFPHSWTRSSNWRSTEHRDHLLNNALSTYIRLVASPVTAALPPNGGPVPGSASNRRTDLPSCAAPPRDPSDTSSATTPCVNTPGPSSHPRKTQANSPRSRQGASETFIVPCRPNGMADAY